jgi:hypothetical protein
MLESTLNTLVVKIKAPFFNFGNIMVPIVNRSGLAYKSTSSSMSMTPIHEIIIEKYFRLLGVSIQVFHDYTIVRIVPILSKVVRLLP